MFFVRAASSDDPPVLWSIPENLSPKEQLKIIGKKFYDFANGTSYVRVHRVNDNKVGFIKLNDFVSRTGISDAKVTTASINGHNIPIALSHVPGRFSSMVKGKSFAETLNAGLSEYVHPAHAAVVAFDGVFSAFHLNSTADAKEAERFFREYVTPEAVQFGPDAIAWPYKFKFTIAWMGEIEAPWYSAYANSVMALNAALMFNMTGESHYRDIARKAINWIRTPVTAGGGLYTIDGFDFVAEYAYPSPPHGNIRVLDGEMISLLSIYSVAVILEDEDMLRFAIRLIYGLSTQLELFTTSNDLIQNARFQWLVDNPGYVIAMKQWATMLHWISKEKAFKRASERWHKSPHYWPAKSYPLNNP
jgi:hypothetical protein